MGRRRKPRLVQAVEITGIADKGKGVARDSEGRVIFVEDVAPGDVVDVLVWKKKKDYWLGRPDFFHRLSSARVTPPCQHFGLCGGCKWQHLSYEGQLAHKEQVVRNALERIAKVTPSVFQPILAAERTTFYRNKLEFSFSNKRWLTREEIEVGTSAYEDVLGFHRAGAYDKIVDIQHCLLQPDPSNAIRNRTRDIAHSQGLSFYDAKTHVGFLRNMVVRVSSQGETMVIISLSEYAPEKMRPFLDELLRSFPDITTLLYCINSKHNDYLLDLEMVPYFGPGFIYEHLGAVKFKVGPKSFFQTNSFQARRLYDTIVDFAAFDGNEIVYDLYTGIGSIALYIARHCRSVIGIEEVPEAIDDARQNALINQIENATFYAGDVKDMLTDEFSQRHGRPDLLITDPPRAGMHPKVVKMLLQILAPRLIYVSCNPATQARDIASLNECYQLEKVRPVDMFPHTHHIESVALLKLKNTTP